jgi:CII-binding regulator of phage lambda lysogenization HflD
MAKMQNLSTAEEAVFSFLRKAFSSSTKKVKPLFEELLEKLKNLTDQPLENRAFMYLDIVSWLESKIQQKPVQTIIRQKFLEAKKRGVAPA